MDIGLWDFGLFILFTLVVFYIYQAWKLKKYERMGIRSLPAYPLVGNFGTVLFRTEHFVEVVKRAYMEFPDEKYIAFFQFERPFLLMRDLELIKQITIKDFDHFEDHIGFFDEKSEPLFGNSLIGLKGQKWRDMRATLSPAFTSSKMKNMFIFVDECAARMAELCETELLKSSGSDGVMEVEIKDTLTRYTNDVIATSAFGLTIDSISDKNNEFYLMGKLITKFTSFQLLKATITMAAPWLSKFVRISIFDPKMTEFFKRIVADQMKYREKNNIIRPDMIHLLMEAKKGSLKHENETPTDDAGFATVQESSIGSKSITREWSDTELIAQAVLFFFAGFESVSALMSLLALELAINKDVQVKLQNEIDDLIRENKKIGYNEIQQMKYMDMVICESLRLWAPGAFADRRCVKPYTFPPPSPGGKPYTMQVGEAVGIPLYAIQRDPNFFNEPDKFDPERFSDENKSNIKPFTYIPFGSGPRNCIGSRFALMEVKSIMFHMLSKFDFVTVPKTSNPIELDRKTMAFTVKGGFWIGLKKR